MRHKKGYKRLGRTSAHRKALFKNMLTALVTRDRIETTLIKAKELKRQADKLITLAKKNTLAARRQAFSLLRDRPAVQKLFSNLVDRFKDRNGGYTRVLKLGFRHGDNAEMAVIQYLTAEVEKKTAKGSEKKPVEKKAKATKEPTKKSTKKSK